MAKHEFRPGSLSPAIPLFRTFIPAEARARAAGAMARGWLGFGPECRELEQRFVQGRRGWALATSSCTSALYLAGLLAKRGSAPEVIVPSLSFVSTAMAFHHAGYKVRFAPVGVQHLMMTEGAVGPLVNGNTVAVVAVHLYGQRCPELAALRALCDDANVALIEDCAHRLDLLDPDPPVGDFACYSFNAVKEVPCGEGGVLWGRDPRHEAHARSASNVGLGIDTMQRASTSRHADYRYSADSGLKLRSNDLAASVVNGALGFLPQWRGRRREQFAFYDTALKALAPTLRPLDRRADDSCLMYVVRIAPQLRDGVRAHLAEQGIATSVHYPSFADHPLFGPEAQTAASRAQPHDSLMTLPTYLEMTTAEQRRVTDALASALASETQAPALGASASM